LRKFVTRFHVVAYPEVLGPRRMPLYMSCSGLRFACATEELSMIRGIYAMKKDFLRIAAVAAVAMSASACSSLPDMPSVPDWVDPTTWFGDDSPSPSAADSGQTPDLAGLPDKPNSQATSDDQQQTAESLAADRSHAKYSADALRGGTEAAAAPPPNQPVVAAMPSLPAASRSSDSDQQSAPAPKPVRTAQTDKSVAAEPTGQSLPGALPAPVPGSTAPETQVATLAPVAAAPAPPPGAEPAVPPSPAVPQRVASIAPSDAALGFKPSTAPPLDPSISQFVASPIIAHYQETASNAGIAAARPVAMASAKPSKLRKPRAAEMGEGGPEAMSGAVVANLDALQPATTTTGTPSVYASAQGLPASGVVFFPGDSTLLSAEGRAQVRAAVDEFKSRGGQGFIRVVGHSSSRTPNMTVERHLQVIFEKSQQRANAVAQEIIHEGIPADKVLVEAVGDSQPVYYESMPKGEDGNRRAEIFFQG
jgi:outer membrane protein OmpA-like peptidoglycan-associated protein